MNNTILAGGEEVAYFGVKVNGVLTHHKYSNRMRAEDVKTGIEMAEGSTVLVEVVPVTADGKELLFG